MVIVQVSNSVKKDMITFTKIIIWFHMITLGHLAEATVFASNPTLKDATLAASSSGLVSSSSGDHLQCLVQCKMLHDAATSVTCTAFSFCQVSGICNLITSQTASLGNISSNAIAGNLTTTAGLGCSECPDRGGCCVESFSGE